MTMIKLPHAYNNHLVLIQNEKVPNTKVSVDIFLI